MLGQVHLDKTVTLLDSPGIVFSSAGGEAAAALRNCTKVRPPHATFPLSMAASSLAHS